MQLMMPPTSHSLSIAVAPLAVAVTATAVAIVTSSIRDKMRVESKCRDLELELSTLRKELKQSAIDAKARGIKVDKSSPRDLRKKQVQTLEEETSAEGGLFVKRVGTIRSIYKLCVGTPRQGLLVPNARGCIELEKIGDASTASSVIGLEGYSHIWVVFVFHLNTKSSNPKRIKSTIAPPALGGKKVGVFATRSPHRFNPIGMTLCKIDRIENIKKTKHTKEKVVIHISGLDLVDGTPVLDIKPFVPVYDSVPTTVALPAWVEGGLATQRDVVIDPSAREELGAILEKDKCALKFYGPGHGERSIQDTVDYALGCIQQVLAMDVRSNFQTKKAREGKFQAERARRLQSATGSVTADICTQQLDNLLIEYTVSESPIYKRPSSVGSGAEDMVTVSSIKLLVAGKQG